MWRKGFTLVEMMVAMALTLFVMVILSQSFIAALDTFSGLKAIGDMDEGLRTAVNNLRSDLLLVYFNKDVNGNPVRLKNLNNTAPTEGFFHIRQGSAPALAGPTYFSEGTDLDSLPSLRANDHVLHFSVNATQLKSRPENVFIADIGGWSELLTKQIDAYPTGSVTPFRTGNTISSQWAEVAYFLQPQGSTNSPNSGSTASGGTPLYKLYRSQFVVIADNSKLANPAPAAPPANISCSAAGGGLAYTPGALAGATTTATRRFDPTAMSTVGATLLLNNVLSFTVQVIRSTDATFVDLNSTNGFPAMYDTAGPNSPFAKLGGSLNLWDNSAATTASLAAPNITALQISIRVWDAKTQGTRQITIIQDM